MCVSSFIYAYIYVCVYMYICKLFYHVPSGVRVGILDSFCPSYTWYVLNNCSEGVKWYVPGDTGLAQPQPTQSIQPEARPRTESVELVEFLSCLVVGSLPGAGLPTTKNERK